MENIGSFDFAQDDSFLRLKSQVSQKRRDLGHPLFSCCGTVWYEKTSSICDCFGAGIGMLGAKYGDRLAGLFGADSDYIVWPSREVYRSVAYGCVWIAAALGQRDALAADESEQRNLYVRDA